MKTILAISLLSTSIILANESDYENTIVQILEDGTEWRIEEIPNNGTDKARVPIIGKSIFQLITVHTTTGVSYLLDEVPVNGFNPKVQFIIKTDDPNIYSGGQRYSRVNKDYEVDFQVSGIILDSQVSEANSVILEEVQSITGLDNQITSNTKTELITRNDIHSASNDNNFGNVGEVKNVYTIYENKAKDAASIVSVTLRIFPDAVGNVLKDNSTEEFGATLESYTVFPRIKIDVKEIYPGASVILRIHPQERAAKDSDDIILVATGNSAAYTNIFSQSEVAEKLKNNEIEATSQPVTYTLSLIERSVFGDITLNQSQFILHSQPIKVNASLIGAE